MTPACIGWHTDPPCPVYGYFHGCKYADGHSDVHVCKCGETTKNIRKRVVVPKR